MDQKEMQNKQIILLTLVVLTLGTFAVILGKIWASDPVPDVAWHFGTTLLGILTGTAITLRAQPRVSPTPGALPPTPGDLAPILSSLVDGVGNVSSLADIPASAAPYPSVDQAQVAPYPEIINPA